MLETGQGCGAAGADFSRRRFLRRVRHQYAFGESLIRQLLYGKRWYRRHFGINSQVAWQPDTFGFTAALPQILKKMDVPYFASQKLTRADPECQRFPFQHFWWEGMDGSQVLALNFSKNNSMIDPVSFKSTGKKTVCRWRTLIRCCSPSGMEMAEAGQPGIWWR